jgi:uncharacterized membrane protein
MATSTPGGTKTNLGLEPNIAGLLCYVPCCVGLVFSVVAAIVEKQSRFVRFHAFQSLLLHGVFVLLWVAIMAVQIGLSFVGLGAVSALINLMSWLVLLVLFALEIVLMIKANGNEEFELPVIGPLARQWV